jgi:opacity protein-like surface antigen
VKLPVELTGLKLKPYVADEVFIPLNDDNITQNRVYAGISFEVLENLTADVFYLWLNGRTADGWNDINVLGTGLRYRF